MDIINLINETPLPTVLVVGGMLFIALALGSQIGGRIEMPADRQKLSGILGGVLLVAGLAFYFLPSLPSSAGTAGGGEQQQNSSASQLGGSDKCFDLYFADISSERITRLESGADSQIVLNASQSKEEPIALEFTLDRQAVGGLIFNFFIDNDLFKITSVVDAQCNGVTTFENITRGGDPKTVQNFDQLELRISGNLYLLGFDYSNGDIKIDFEQIVE